jgi:hypothetical protein
MQSRSCSAAIAITLALILPACIRRVPEIGPDQPTKSSDNPTVTKTDGSCLEFNFYANETGVTVVDAAGRRLTRPGKVGSTGGVLDVSATIDPNPAEASRETKTTVVCGCTNKEYTSAGACLDECKASLACFTNICGPGASVERVCVKTRVHMAFEPDVRIFVLQWDPPSSASADCLAEKARFDEQVLRHERRHREIALEVAELANMEWEEGKPFEACADTEKQAREMLDAMIEQAVDSASERANRETDRRNEEFHEQESHAKELDCSRCS